MEDKITIVSPVYNAGKIVPELVRRIVAAVSGLTSEYEIILVDDRSKDDSWEKILEESTRSSRVKGIRLSRNFGQHFAITAGLNHAKGDYVVVMDCDLQDNPEYIGEMVQLAKKGNDVVFTSKKSRSHSFFKNVTAKMFSWLFNNLASGPVKADWQVGTFSLLSSKAVREFNRINDVHRHYLMVVRYLGFQSAVVNVQHDKRYAGKSSYSFGKLIKHAVNGVTSQSVRLLHFSVAIGFIFFLISIVGSIYYIVSYILNGALPGFTSLVLIMLLSTGLILISIGVAGIYIGKIFEQSKNRPLYIIDSTVNI